MGGAGANIREYILFRSSEGRARNGNGFVVFRVADSSSEGYADACAEVDGVPSVLSMMGTMITPLLFVLLIILEFVVKLLLGGSVFVLYGLKRIRSTAERLDC